MCTFNIQLDDQLMERVRPAFNDDSEVQEWMQKQIEVIVSQLARSLSSDSSGKAYSSRLQRLRALSRPTITVQDLNDDERLAYILSK